MLITFEGIDGSGKTTQIQKLEEWFLEKGHTVNVFREPGGTELSELIRGLLLNPEIEMDDVTEALLFSAARSQLISEVVKPALDRKEIVILDRFYDSTVAYQGYARQAMPLDRINHLNEIASHGLVPDITLYIRISLETSLQRTKHMQKDRMEQSDHQFYERVIAGFDNLATEEKRFVEIDGESDEVRVHMHVVEAVCNHPLLQI